MRRIETVAEQWREHIIRPTLLKLGLWSLSAERLLLGTAVQESGLQYVVQLGGGPALGAWQMERRTHDDIWDNYLEYRPGLRDAVLQFLAPWPPQESREIALVTNAAYCCAMARVHYYRVPQRLPDSDDLPALARYWKEHYNTAKGAGTTLQFMRAAHRAGV